MDAVQSGLCHTLEMFVADPGDSVGSGIGGDSFDHGKAELQMAKDGDDLLGFDDQTVAVLEKNGLHTAGHKVIGSMKRHLVLHPALDEITVVASARTFGRGNRIDVGFDRVDIIEHMFNRAQAELFTLVHRAERTPVPRAVAGDPDQQALCLAGRPDRALLKAVVGGCFFHLSRVDAGLLLVRFSRRFAEPDGLVVHSVYSH